MFFFPIFLAGPIQRFKDFYILKNELSLDERKKTYLVLFFAVLIKISIVDTLLFPLAYDRLYAQVVLNLESGVINYGEEFTKSMESGGWDLSKVDREALKKSQATLVFGQMNEPPGVRARVALSGLSVAESFRDGDEESGGRDILLFIDNIFSIIIESY